VLPSVGSNYNYAKMAVSLFYITFCLYKEDTQRPVKEAFDGTDFFKKVNICLNNNIYSYFETSGGPS
jgi:hypothetical protein